MNQAAEIVATIEGELEEVWPRAIACWSTFLLLSRPSIALEQSSIAFIDLGTRRVSINGRQIVEKNLVGSLEAILAHEIGHHVKFPATLAMQARLRVVETSIRGKTPGSYLNLFTDLLINERLPERLRPQLADVYRTFAVDSVAKRDRCFLFYLSIYEAIYGLERGSIVAPAGLEVLDEKGAEEWRADSAAIARTLFGLAPNIFTQLVYFLSIFSKYEPPAQEGCGIGEPSADDWADAMVPSKAERDAIDRAVAEGWIRPGQGKRGKPGEPRIDSLPAEVARSVPDIMAAHYRRLADRWLLKPPPELGAGEKLIPTTTEEWEPGDAVSSIDWITTTRSRGADMGAALPLRRERIAEDEGYDAGLGPMRVEVYLDVSGSMPNPTEAINVLTLAAEILALGAIRAGGFVRALMYASEVKKHWTWSRSEREMSRFLMNYLGSGTDFPFSILEESVGECRSRQPIRIIISDTDFDGNFSWRANARQICRAAAAAGPGLILLQHQGIESQAEMYRGLGMRVVIVKNASDIPRTAADLAEALFDKQRK